MCKILEQYSDKIKGTFSFFDRMIINGYINPLMNEHSRIGSLYQLGVLYKDFKSYFMSVTETIIKQIEDNAIKLSTKCSQHRTTKHPLPLNSCVTLNHFVKSAVALRKQRKTIHGGMLSFASLRVLFSNQTGALCAFQFTMASLIYCVKLTFSALAHCAASL